MKNALLTLAVLLSASICNSSSRLQAVTVPAGAAMRVRTIDLIDLNSARPGARFRGSLADSVKSKDGTVLIPRGAPVELRAVNVARPGRMRPRDRVDLRVDSVAFNGETYPIVSTGAAVGGLVGGGGGTAVAASSAGNLRIPSETVLSFQLQRALRVK